MIECPKCGNGNEDDSRFCDQCGAPVAGLPGAPETANPEPSDPEAADPDGGCPDCGGRVRRLGEGKGVCLNCGETLVEEDDAPAKGVPAAERPPAPEGDWTPVYTSRDGIGAYAEAAMIRSQLEAAGFVCEIFNAQHSTMVLGGGLSIGIRVMVPASQAEAARRFLDDAGRTRVVGPME